MVQQQGGNAVSGLRGIEIWREVVPVGDTLEGRIHDRRNSSQIACGRRASRYRHDSLPGFQEAISASGQFVTTGPRTFHIDRSAHMGLERPATLDARKHAGPAC
jgi:hypothetical protein